MPSTNFKKVVVNALQDSYGSQGMTHDTIAVTKTATMENGSILKSDGTEAAILDAATATHILDATNFEVVSVGETVLVSAAAKNVQVLTSSLKFSDGAYTAEALTALEAAGVELV